jgi:hypothetical protein
MEPEDEVIGLTMGQDISWLQATLMKVGIVNGSDPFDVPSDVASPSTQLSFKQI